MMNDHLVGWYEASLPLSFENIENDEVAQTWMQLGANGVEERKNPSRLVGYFTKTKDEKEAVLAIINELSTLYDFESSTVSLDWHEELDWADRWKEFFKPLRLGQHVWIVPSWEKAPETVEGDILVELDPGMAFGTGQHETTALTMGFIEDYIAQKNPNVEILDVGTGSGILAISALKLGAARVVGTDNDAYVIPIAIENAEKNDVADRFEASTTPLEEIEERFELVDANILAHILLDLAPGLIKRTRDDGTLLLCGLLTREVGKMVTAFEKEAATQGRPEFKLREQRDAGEWTALRFGKE